MMKRRTILTTLALLTSTGASAAQTLEAEKDEMALAMDPEPVKVAEEEPDDGDLFVLGLDFDGALALDEEEVDPGMGGALRLGWQLEWLSWLSGRPELVGSAYFFGGDNGPKLFRSLAGLRLAFESTVRVGAFSHAGMGHVDSPVDGATRTSFAWDVGAEFGVTLTPLLGLGVHGAYNSATNGTTPSNFNYGSAGLHIELRL